MSEFKDRRLIAEFVFYLSFLNRDDMKEMLSNLSPNMIFSLLLISLILVFLVFGFLGYSFVKPIIALSYDAKDQKLRVKRQINKSK